MRRSWTSWLSAALVLLCCAAPVRAAQSTTRVFAMQPKLDLAWMESRQTFHDKLFGLTDKSLRRAGKPLVQDGADDVASHLRGDGRNLVVWPEDIGLWAAFTGDRGRSARGSGSLESAVGGLFSAYSSQTAYYGQRYPEAAARVPQIRLLAIGLTDTFGRVALETYSELASKYKVWLEAGVNMVRTWHVVCVTDEHPPQEPCDEQDPVKVQTLGDPGEPSRGYAYEATSPDVSNMALVFGPDGKLVSKQVKTYLTPSEVGRPEGQVAALDFVPGSITSGLSAVPTPVGTLGFVTSKDAWMPDVIDRLEAQGVDLLLQPEFFAGDLATTEGMWSTDTLKASGYSDLLRHPGFQSFALAEAVGNVFDFSADQQSHIAIRSAKPGGGKWLLGQPPSPGLVGVTPWVVPDPARRGELTAERRKRLGEAGKKLMPGSKVKCADPAKPGPCENGHVEGVLWRDVPVGVPDAPASKVKLMRRRFSAAQPLATGTSPERNAAIAAAGKWVAVVFEQERPEGARVMVAVSQDSGSHWDPATEVAPAAPGDQWWPAVAITRDGAITVAWTASAPARVVFAQGRGAAFGAPQPIDPSAPADLAQWKPALALGSGGVVHAAFVDARTRSADAGLPQAGIYYTRIKAGIPDAAKRLDGGTPAPLAAKMDNAWSPALAVRGSRVLATWLDFTNYDWDVFSRESSDGGDSFDRALDANPEPADIEDLSDSPKPVLTARASFLTWTDFHKRPSVKAPHPLYDIYLAQRDKPPLQADPYGARQVSTFWPSACADGRDILVAFQDSATGVAHIRITRIKRGAKRGHAFVVDNSSAAAYRPALACSGRRAIAAWEDARGGPPRIYSAFAGTSRIR